MQLAMIAHGFGIMPLTDKMEVEIPEPLKPLFMGDVGVSSEAKHAAWCLEFLLEHGPP